MILELTANQKRSLQLILNKIEVVSNRQIANDASKTNFAICVGFDEPDLYNLNTINNKLNTTNG